MTQDARNSLIALVSVCAIFGALYLFMLLVEDVIFPSWMPLALLGLCLLQLIISLALRWRERSQRAKKSKLPS